MKHIIIKKNADQYRYGVGTNQTGSFLSYDTEQEAINEAKDWRDTENITVNVYLLKSNGDVIDTIHTYNPHS